MSIRVAAGDRDAPATQTEEGGPPDAMPSSLTAGRRHGGAAGGPVDPEEGGRLQIRAGWEPPVGLGAQRRTPDKEKGRWRRRGLRRRPRGVGQRGDQS